MDFFLWRPFWLCIVLGLAPKGRLVGSPSDKLFWSNRETSRMRKLLTYFVSRTQTIYCRLRGLGPWRRPAKVIAEIVFHIQLMPHGSTWWTSFRSKRSNNYLLRLMVNDLRGTLGGSEPLGFWYRIELLGDWAVKRTEGGVRHYFLPVIIILITQEI